MYSGPTDPRQGAYRNAVIWFDTAADVLKVWNDQINPPGWTRYDLDDYLAKSGGTMTTQAKINFANETGDKINLYAADFGLGINSGETVVYASGKIGFRDKGFDGTQWGYVDSGGFVSGGRRVHSGYREDAIAITAGSYYRICFIGDNGGGGSRFSAYAITGNTGAHLVAGWVNARTHSDGNITRRNNDRVEPVQRHQDLQRGQDPLGRRWRRLLPLPQSRRVRDHHPLRC